MTRRIEKTVCISYRRANKPWAQDGFTENLRTMVSKTGSIFDTYSYTIPKNLEIIEISEF